MEVFDMGGGFLVWSVLTVAGFVLALLALVDLLRKGSAPVGRRVAWVLAIILVPVVGPLLYLLLGRKVISRQR